MLEMNKTKQWNWHHLPTPLIFFRTTANRIEGGSAGSATPLLEEINSKLNQIVSESLAPRQLEAYWRDSLQEPVTPQKTQRENVKKEGRGKYPQQIFH